MLTYEDCVAFSGNTNYSVAAQVATGEAAAPDSVKAQATPLRSYRNNINGRIDSVDGASRAR